MPSVVTGSGANDADRKWRKKEKIEAPITHVSKPTVIMAGCI